MIETAVVVDQQEAVIPDISTVPASQEVSSKSDTEEIMQDPVPEDVKTTDLPAEALDNRKGMEILFGTDSTTGNELFWLPNDTNQVFHTNTGIIGTMGTGKTQFIRDLCDKYDVPFDLMSKLMISVDNSKFYTRSAVVAKNVEKILNEGWLHFEAIREGLNHED